MRDYLKHLGLSFYVLSALLLTSPYYFYSYNNFHESNGKPISVKNIQTELKKDLEANENLKLPDEKKQDIALKTGALLFPLLLTVALLHKGYYFVILWNLIFFICIISLSFAMTFEAFRRFSKYGFSKNYCFLNDMVSILAIVLAFASFSLKPEFLILTLAIIGYSFFVSPDTQAEKEKPIYRRQYFPVFMTAGVLLTLTITKTFVTEAYIYNDANKTAITDTTARSTNSTS